MDRLITVQGTGTVSASPDSIVIPIELKAKSFEYEKTTAIAEQQLKALQQALAEAGIAENEIKTCDFSVSREYRNEKDQSGNYRNVFDGYSCRHSLQVTFDLDMKKLGGVLGALSACDANAQFHIRFTVKDREPLVAEMLESAAADARAKAEILCRASGAALGLLVKIDYGYGKRDFYSATNYTEDCGVQVKFAKCLDIHPMDVQETETVTFTWAIL